jgi:uncharacterized protein (DUF885 family)
MSSALTSAPTGARQLADRFNQAWLAIHPFEASYMGIPGLDDRVPDASDEGRAAWRTQVGRFIEEARQLGGDLSDADAVTRDCVVGYLSQELDELDSKADQYTVSPMPFTGPPALLAVCARTVLPDAKAAGDYLARLRAGGTWIDQQTEQLRVGQAKGRLPVAPLVELTIRWAENVLASPVPQAVATPDGPPGWDGEPAFSDERDAIAADVLKPAIARWVEQLERLLPLSRPSERPGLTYLPEGDADYQRAIRLHTTLEVSPERLHQTGLDEVQRLEQRAFDLGATIGLDGLDAVHEAIHASALLPPSEAIEKARQAVRRAEFRAREVFTEPLPEPCAVEPMAPVVALSGMAPHYSPPRLDGSRPGTYWFNTEVPTAGTGWDLEGVAFHEAVPGHHLQLARIQMLTGLSDLQRQRELTVYSEGWALYAEQLAEEMGLYSGTQTLLGATTAALMRAARLVIDTGLHAFGWSRQQALEFFVAHVPLPPEFLANEVDRYISWPGQALAYLTGKLEIIRAREEAQRRLGLDFDLSAFHSALLDQGSLPVGAMHAHIDRWLNGQ